MSIGEEVENIHHFIPIRWNVVAEEYGRNEYPEKIRHHDASEFLSNESSHALSTYAVCFLINIPAEEKEKRHMEGINYCCAWMQLSFRSVWQEQMPETDQ